MEFGRRLRFVLGILALVFGSGSAAPWLEQWHDCPAQMMTPASPAGAESMAGMDMGGHEHGKAPEHPAHHRCRCFCSNAPLQHPMLVAAGFDLPVRLPTSILRLTLPETRRPAPVPHLLPFALPPPSLG